MRTFSLLVAILSATSLMAMPTAEEIAKAEPLVQEVMKSEMDALRLNRKTRQQVGAAAFKLAQEAQDQVRADEAGRAGHEDGLAVESHARFGHC